VEAETVKKSKLEQKVATCQEKIEELEENRQTVTASLESLRASVDELETQKLDVLRERRAKEKKHRDVIMKLKSQKRNKNEVEGSIDEFKRKIAEIRRRQRARDRIDSTQVRAELEGKLEAMRTKSEELRSKLDEVKREHKEAEDTADDTTKQLRETRYKVEEKEEALHHIERNMRTMESARQDRMRVFGPWVPQLLEEIRRNRSRFRQMPKGPLGSMMSVLEQKWAPVVERCFKREFFPAFLCDNHADSELLKSIMRRVIDRRNRIPDVYTTPFRGSVYRYKDTMPSSSYPTMLSVIDVHDPDVLNLILDMHQPHKVLLIEDPRVAREYIFFNCPPKASKAYALDACEIFPSGNFYHGYSNLRAFYFQPNREDNVRSMKEEATQLNQDLKTIKESRDDLERVSLQQRERLKYLKSTIRDFIQQQRDLSAKEKDCEQRLATLAEDDEQETEEEIASCETEIAHLNEELEEIGRQMEETQEEMEEMENEIDRIGVDLDNLSSEHARLKEKINHDREKWDTFDEKVRRLTARKGELEGKAQTVEQNLTKLQKGVSEQRRLCEETREKVLRLDHGREITTSRSSRELETEIKSIEDLLEQERGE
jgi:chromosome segregation ATPase